MSVSHKSYHQPERAGGAAINRTYETQAGCPHPSKVAFLGRKDAKLALRRVRDKRLAEGGKLVNYLCVCGAYHLGNRPAWADDRNGLRELSKRKIAA